MSENEGKLVPYTLADYQKLAAAQSALTGRVLPFGLGAVIAIVFWQNFTHPLLRIVIGLVITLYVLAFTVLLLRYLSFRKDIKGGDKLELAGVVAEVKEDPDEPARYSFRVMTPGREIPVMGADYQQFKEGDKVLVTVGPNSAQLLGVATAKK